MKDETLYTLREAAEQLGLHYMTIYRYVRTGRLEAQQSGAHWVIPARELQRFQQGSVATGGTKPKRSRRGPGAIERLVGRLLAGDENGAWGIAQEMLAGGASPKQVYLELFVPALQRVGQLWEQGKITVADEHRASGVTQRLVGRMGPLFRPRGPRVGTVIVGTPAGETHALPTALVADILRGEGFDVVDLGADVPAAAFAAYALGVEGLVGVAIVVTVARHQRNMGILLRTLRDAGVMAPFLVGGAGVTEEQARALGADHWTPDADAVVRILAAR